MNPASNDLLRHRNSQSPASAIAHRRLLRRSSMPIAIAVLVALIALFLVTVLKSFGINQEYQRGVLFRLGRLGAMKGPGWYWLVPFVDRVVRVDQRIITYQLETQETITRDGAAGGVNAG